MSIPLLTIIANPYCYESSWFKFSDFEEYCNLYEKQLKQKGTEEYEFDLFDADELASYLWKIMKVDQCNLEKFFEIYDSYQLDDLESLLKFKICIEHFKMDVEEAFEQYKEVLLYEGTPEEYVREFYDEHYEIPDFLSGYIDFSKLAQDWEFNASIIHYEDEGFVHTNPEGI